MRCGRRCGILKRDDFKQAGEWMEKLACMQTNARSLTSAANGHRDGRQLLIATSAIDEFLQFRDRNLFRISRSQVYILERHPFLLKPMPNVVPHHAVPRRVRQ